MKNSAMEIIGEVFQYILFLLVCLFTVLYVLSNFEETRWFFSCFLAMNFSILNLIFISSRKK